MEEKIVPSENQTIKFNKINKGRDIQPRDKMNQRSLQPQRVDTNIIEDVNVKWITEHLLVTCTSC